MTQADRVIALLRAAGPAGVHSFELRREPHLIANPSERIRELEARGYTISVSAPERLHGRAYGVRYRLEASPAPATRLGVESRSIAAMPLSEELARAVPARPSIYDPFAA